MYLIVGYEVILAPGRLYKTFVDSNSKGFHREVRIYALLILAITTIRVVRGFVTDVLANTLRLQLSLRVHSYYLSSSTSLLNIVNSNDIDSPDQQIVADARDFSYSLVGIVAGSPSDASGGAIEAVLSIVWYSVALSKRTGVHALLIAYAWSTLGAALSAIAISFAAKTRVKSESSEAELRYAHSLLRSDADSIAFEGTHHWRRNFIDNLLYKAFDSRRAVVLANVPLSTANHGFAYCVTLVMYGSIALVSSTNSYFQGLSSGEKAQWVSQTGAVFLQLLYAFSMIVSLAPKISSFVAQTHRLHLVLSILKRPSSRSTSIDSDEDQDRIECRELCIALPDGQVTQPISFNLEQGQRILLTGKSGYGKTSFLRTIRGLDRPRSGSISSIPANTVFVAQQGELAPGLCTLRQCIFQSSQLRGTVHELIQVQEALKIVGWERPDSIDELRSWSNILSAGERQILAIARIIVKRPRFAVLDEPTSALDRATETRCFLALSSLDIGLLTVSHSVALESFHDQVICMEKPIHSRTDSEEYRIQQRQAHGTRREPVVNPTLSLNQPS